MNTLDINLQENEELTSLTSDQISFNNSGVVLKGIENTNNSIVLKCSYTVNVDEKYIAVTYKESNQTIYRDITTILLQYSFPLVYCEEPDRFILRASIFSVLSFTLDTLYLLAFTLSLFTCNKMYGLELMSVIQLGYYSLIPINVFCLPFSSLSALRLSSGFNPLFQSLQQTPISMNYDSLDIRSNFLTNVNLMLLPLFVLPFCYFPLKYIGGRSQDCKTRPRCLKYSKAFLCEVPLTILLFNSFNICTSFVVSIQAFGWSNLPSLFTSFITVSLFPIAAGLLFKFRGHFSEFKD